MKTSTLTTAVIAGESGARVHSTMSNPTYPDDAAVQAVSDLGFSSEDLEDSQDDSTSPPVVDPSSGSDHPISPSSSSPLDSESESDDEETELPAAARFPNKEEVIIVYRTAGKRALMGLNCNNEPVRMRPGGEYYSHSGKHYKVLFSDELIPIKCREKSIGHYIYDSERPALLPRCPFAVVMIPKIKIGTHEIAERLKVVCHPLVNKLEEKFLNPFLSESMINAFLACAAKEFPKLEFQIRTDSIDYYVSKMYARKAAVMSKENVEILNETALRKSADRTYIEPCDFDSKAYVNSLGETFETDSFIRAYGTLCSTKADESYNNNWDIVNARGYMVKDKTTGELRTAELGDNPAQGDFETATNEYPKLYKTVFARITGAKDFEHQDASGANVTLAKSRMTKAREGEQELRRNQGLILSHLSGQHKDADLLFCCSNSNVTVPHEEPEDSVGKMARGRVARFFTGEHTLSSSIWYLVFEALWFMCFFCMYLSCAFLARLNYCTVNLICKTKNRFLGGYWNSCSWTILSKPSPKRALYFSAWEKNLHLTGHNYEDQITSAEEPQAKFKNEFGKPGKHGRLYVTYGDSIIYAGWYWSYLKNFFCSKYFLPPCVSGATCELNHQVVGSLEEDYKYTTTPPEGLSSRVFSDDMSLQYRSKRCHDLFDMDISSCDSGNTYAMFYILGLVMMMCKAPMEMIYNSYKRLRQPIVMRNPSAPREFLRMQPKTIFQGSGCPETTAVNGVASTCIVVSVHAHICYYQVHPFKTERGVDFFYDDLDQSDKTKILIMAATAVGHKVTIDWRNSPQERQFLKYSHAKTVSGRWVDYRNIGTMFRSLGSVDGDISARTLGVSTTRFQEMSYADKMEMHCSGVVNGLKNEPDHAVMRALRKRFPPRSISIKTTYHATCDRSRHVIDDEQLHLRYGTSQGDLDAFIRCIENMSFGTHQKSDFLTAVMEIDYGLS